MMTLWPFRKRSKTNNGEKLEKGETRRDDSPKQGTKGKQPEPPPSAIPEFPLPPNNRTTFVPPKQNHHGGFSSDFLEHSHTSSDASDSTHLPHKAPHKPKLLRKLSKKSPARESQKAQHAYITPPTSGADDSSPEMKKSRFGRSSSKLERKKGAFNWFGHERSTTFPPPARDITSSLSSNSSVRPLKPRLKGFEKFVPRPNLIFGYETPADSEHSQPQNTSARKQRLVSEEELAASSTVDGLADDLDARGLREAMERDHRRRERKKLEEQRQLEKRMERRLMRQKAAEEMEFDADIEIGDSSVAGPAFTGISTGPDQAPLPPSPVSEGAQTPVSWLQDPLVDGFSKSDPPYQTFESEEPSRRSSKHVIPDMEPQTPPKTSPEGARRAKLTSFLRKATASRIRKEHASYKIRAGESAQVSNSEGYRNRDYGPQPGLSHIWKNTAQSEVQPTPMHHGSKARSHNAQEIPSGSDSSLQNSQQEFIGLPGPLRPVVSKLNEPPMDPQKRTPQASLSETTSEVQNEVSQGTAHLRHDSRAVSPNAPSAISTLASIDSEGSWLSGKISRQSFSRQSGNVSRQSFSRQSNTHPSPLRASSRNNYGHDAMEDETEDDDFYGKIESRHEQSNNSKEAFEVVDEDDETIDNNEVLDLSEVDDSDDSPGKNENNTGRIRDGYARSPEIHEPEWRMSSRIGYLKFYDDEDQEPPSPTAATFGGECESSGPTHKDREYHACPLQHPFAEEGENFVSPLEHLAETRPQYTGVV